MKKHTRQTLIEENLLSLRDKVPVSERNVHIVKDYTSGMTLAEVGKKYQISMERVRAIVVSYISYCHRYLRNLENEGSRK